MTKSIMPKKSQKSKNLMHWALFYATKLGWHVFPVRPRGKEPLTPHGFKDATTDPQRIKFWWRKWPNANIGIACAPSGLAVLDCDPRHGGEETLAACRPLPLTPQVKTGGGGLHFYFRLPPGVTVANKTIGPGLELKVNGYVVAPPSVHPSGERYTWDILANPQETPLAELPSQLLDSEEAERDEKASGVPERIPEGERNVQLTKLAGALRRRGLGEEEIRATLLIVNRLRCDPPLPEKEVAAIAKSIAKYPPGEVNFHLGKGISPEIARQIEERQIPLWDSELAGRITRTLAGLDGAKGLPIRVRRELAGDAMLAWLKEHGTFVRSEENKLYYFYEPERKLFSLESEVFRAWLHCLTGVNPASPDFEYLLSDCKTMALNSPVRKVVRVAYFDKNTDTLRVSNFAGKVYVLDGREIKTEPNGALVLFEDDPNWASYEPKGGSGNALQWATSDIPNWDGQTEEEEAMWALGYKVWCISTFFTELCPTRPILVLTGERGSGKTMVLRLLLKFFFGPRTEVAGVPDRPDAFTAAVAASHIYIMDNMDALVPWLRDKLARLATGGEDYLRKLYTTNDKITVRYRAWVGITSQDPETLRRGDLAERVVILPVRRVSDDMWRPEREFLEQVEIFRDAWWGDVLTILNRVVGYIREHGLPPTAAIRLGDWESLGRVIARVMGEEALWDKFVAGLLAAQAEFLVSEDLILEALAMWCQDEGNWGREITTRELYTELTEALFGDGKPSPDWPRSVKAFGRALMEKMPGIARYYNIERRILHGHCCYRISPKQRVD